MAKGSTEPRGMNGIVRHGFGLRNHNEAAFKYQTDKNTETSLKNLGYAKYNASNLDIDWLQSGDLLYSQNHVEYYVGNNYHINFKETTEITRNKKKKAGTEDIVRDGSNTKTLKEIIIIDGEIVLREKLDNSGNTIPAAQGTFGWGGVNDEFPLENTKEEMAYFYKVGNVFRKCTCGCVNDMTVVGNHSTDCQTNNLKESYKYTVVWRYER